MFERFTKQAREQVGRAMEIAADAGADSVRPPHLLAAILADESSPGCRVLAALGADPAALREDLDGRTTRITDGLDAADAEALSTIGIDLEEVLRHVGDERRPRRGRPSFSRAAKKVLELSLREAIALRHHGIGSEHLLLALVRQGDATVREALAAQGVEPEALRSAVADPAPRTG